MAASRDAQRRAATFGFALVGILALGALSLGVYAFSQVAARLPWGRLTPERAASWVVDSLPPRDVAPGAEEPPAESAEWVPVRQTEITAEAAEAQPKLEAELVDWLSDNRDTTGFVDAAELMAPDERRGPEKVELVGVGDRRDGADAYMAIHQPIEFQADQGKWETLVPGVTVIRIQLEGDPGEWVPVAGFASFMTAEGSKDERSVWPVWAQRRTAQLERTGRSDVRASAKQQPAQDASTNAGLSSSVEITAKALKAQPALEDEIRPWVLDRTRQDDYLLPPEPGDKVSWRAKIIGIGQRPDGHLDAYVRVTRTTLTPGDDPYSEDQVFRVALSGTKGNLRPAEFFGNEEASEGAQALSDFAAWPAWMRTRVIKTGK